MNVSPAYTNELRHQLRDGVTNGGNIASCLHFHYFTLAVYYTRTNEATYGPMFMLIACF